MSVGGGETDVKTHVVVLEMRAQDAAAELADV